MTRLRHEGKDPSTGEDRWSLRLLELEANILTGLPDQLEALLANPGSNRRVIGRLFPASYDDPEEEALNRQLLGDSLMQDRKQGLADIRSQLDEAKQLNDGLEMQLDRSSIDLWLRFMNDVRLILATDLGIEQNIGEQDDEGPAVDAESPDAPKYALLEYLGGVEAILVDAVTRAG